ncbi:MAG: ribosome silencing factor [Helicobacter sp.]|nr:ribosome silencing factor [Helicobacter sp.]
MIKNLMNLLDDKKAENIVHISLHNRDYVVSDVVIATALAGKHGLSLIDEIKKLAKNFGLSLFGSDLENDEWLVLDFGDLMIHIFTQNVRDKIKLEEFLSEFQKTKPQDQPF